MSPPPRFRIRKSSQASIAGGGRDRLFNAAARRGVELRREKTSNSLNPAFFSESNYSVKLAQMPLAQRFSFHQEKRSEFKIGKKKLAP